MRCWKALIMKDKYYNQKIDFLINENVPIT